MSILAIAQPQAPHSLFNLPFGIPPIVIFAIPLVILLLLARTIRGNNRKPIGGVLAASGAFLVIFAIVRLNSLQFSSINDDPLPVILLICAVPATLVGVWMMLGAGSTK